MKRVTTTGFSRRGFLAIGGGALFSAALPVPLVRAGTAAIQEYRLRAGLGRATLVGPPYPETEVWCYNGAVPGPVIRARQGSRLRLVVENGLAEPTTVHWHGVRVPNAMDGVPGLTQEPIASGASFVYEFEVPDAGTYWYHPHQRSFEQTGRGLAGPLIVEEATPPAVDRDEIWVLQDWRLLPDARQSDDFGNMHDVSHAGRIGNTVTVNGRVPEAFPVRAGERLRLRLVNAANARIFGLEFRGHRPLVVALDGQPVEAHTPDDGRIVLGPAMRADVILDMVGKLGERFTVMDTFYPRLRYRLLDLVYDTEPLRREPPRAAVELPANPLPEPNVATAERHLVVLGGGMMGGMGGGMMGGMGGGMMGMAEMMRRGLAWSINGVAVGDHVHEPLVVLRRGVSCVLELRNETAWHHPIHLHGHSFRVIARDGQPTRYREWQDTVLLKPRERADIAFVADNPGDWMLHCHVLEHQAGGMMAAIRVA